MHDEIERAGHAVAMLQKRKKALVSRDWAVEPGSDLRIDGAAAKLVERQRMALPFHKVCVDLPDARPKGGTISEIQGLRGGAERPDRAPRARPTRRCWTCWWTAAVTCWRIACANNGCVDRRLQHAGRRGALCRARPPVHRNGRGGKPKSKGWRCPQRRHGGKLLWKRK